MAVRYGLVPLMATRNQIDMALGRWYFQCLPALGVNHNIRKEWRMLPLQFQGLGLPNLSLEKLADSLKLLQRHWGTNSDLGRALKCSFELIQVETGLQGNFLLRDYSSLGSLATHSWFGCLWELTSSYQVKVVLANTTVPAIRENDKVVMEEAIKVLPSQQWASFNRARKKSTYTSCPSWSSVMEGMWTLRCCLRARTVLPALDSQEKNQPHMIFQCGWPPSER